MDEKELFKLSLVISFIGLLLLILISNNIEIETYNIDEIDEKLVNKDLKIKGKILRLAETPGLLILDIQDNTGTITAVLFKDSPLNLTINQEIELQGQVQKYKDKFEVVVEQVVI